MELTAEKAPPAETPEQTIARLEAENARLKELATKDPLTGIYNRRGIEEIIRQEVAATGRGTGGDLLIIYFDLDYFKKINDVYGHARGDETLKEFARIVEEDKRETDFWGRPGGEEFTLVAPTTPGTNRKGIEKMLERYAKKIKGSIIIEGKPQTVSIGCAILRKGQPMDSEQVKLATDKALYASKNEGRDRYTIVDLGAEEQPALIS